MRSWKNEEHELDRCGPGRSVLSDRYPRVCPPADRGRVVGRSPAEDHDEGQLRTRDEPQPVGDDAHRLHRVLHSRTVRAGVRAHSGSKHGCDAGVLVELVTACGADVFPGELRGVSGDRLPPGAGGVAQTVVEPDQAGRLLGGQPAPRRCHVLRGRLDREHLEGDRCGRRSQHRLHFQETDGTALLHAQLPNQGILSETNNSKGGKKRETRGAFSALVILSLVSLVLPILFR